MKAVMRDFLIHMATGLVCAAAVFYLGYRRGYLLLRCVCDAFFVASVLLVCVGSIKAVRNKGIFDVTGYGVKYTAELVFPMLRGEKKENLYEYRERKALERKSARGLLLAGAVYFLLAIVTLVLYESVHG